MSSDSLAGEICRKFSVPGAFRDVNDWIGRLAAYGIGPDAIRILESDLLEFLQNGVGSEKQ